MFEASLFESESPLRMRNGRGIAIAAIVQTLALSGLLLAPLFSPARLPQHAFQMTLATPAPPVQVIPPLRQPVPFAASAASALDVLRQSFSAPRIIPHGIPDASDMPEFNGSAAPAIGNDTGSDVGNLLNKLGDTRSPMVRPAAPAVKRGPVRVSGGVMQGQLDSPILPSYPAIARSAHMQGTIVVAAVISRTGAIEKLQVISGPMILRQAAIDAIERAHYKPFRLNGEPIEVETTISVVFSLGDTR
jgi:protein TonB